MFYSRNMNDFTRVPAGVTAERFSNGLVYSSSAEYEALFDFVTESGFTWTDKGFINMETGVQATWVDHRGLYHCSWMAITK